MNPGSRCRTTRRRRQTFGFRVRAASPAASTPPRYSWTISWWARERSTWRHADSARLSRLSPAGLQLAVHSLSKPMAALTLEIANPRDASPHDATHHVFGEDGGSIGRAPSSSWVLTQNKVSGQHAQISFRSGVFYIQDMSRNGVSVNSPDNRLIRNRPYALKAGDRIFIEPYEIDVWTDPESAHQVRPTHLDPFSEDPFAPQHDALLPDQNLGAIPASPVNQEVDPLKFFDPVANRLPRKPEPFL